MKNFEVKRPLVFYKREGIAFVTFQDRCVFNYLVCLCYNPLGNNIKEKPAAEWMNKEYTNCCDVMAFVRFYAFIRLAVTLERNCFSQS